MDNIKSKIIFSLFTALLFVGCCNSPQEQKETLTVAKNGQIEPILTREDTINAMAWAFARQESNFNHTAVSPCGRWVGCLQISKICVAEANRIVGFKCFFDGSEGYIDDRLDRQGSYAIFKIIQEHHNPDLNLDKAIDIWNRKCPDSYRNNIKNNFVQSVTKLFFL